MARSPMGLLPRTDPALYGPLSDALHLDTEQQSIRHLLLFVALFPYNISVVLGRRRNHTYGSSSQSRVLSNLSPHFTTTVSTMSKERWLSLYRRSIGCPCLLTTAVTLAFCVLWMGAGIGSGWSIGIGRDHDGWDMVDTRSTAEVLRVTALSQRLLKSNNLKAAVYRNNNSARITAASLMPVLVGMHVLV